MSHSPHSSRRSDRAGRARCDRPAPCDGPRLAGAFTLAEMVVVIIIMAIAAAIIIPQAVGTSSLQAQSAARMVMADLEYAQSEAIFTQSLVTVTFDSAGNSYTISNASGPLVHPINKEEYVVDLDSQTGLESVSISAVSFAGSAVTFDALGAPDSGGSVTVSAKEHAYQITVAPVSGRVTVTRLP